jgi:hypothetical protein
MALGTLLAVFPGRRRNPIDPVSAPLAGARRDPSPVGSGPADPAGRQPDPDPRDSEEVPV